MLFLIHRKNYHIQYFGIFDASEREKVNDLRLSLELKNRNDEVVILEANSLSALRKTHGRYF